MSDVRKPATDQVPTSIGRYQITGNLGYGAMGAVYKAFDPLIKRQLAIKTVRLDIPRSSPQYRSFIDRFQHEAQISGTLSHPGIVTLFDLGDENGDPFFAMEFVDGRTIADVLAEGTRFKPEKVIGLVSQVAAALDYAHSRGVVHRDIKPANLILYDDDKVKVTDFGIAKLQDADITHSGALLGTPSYMSPEQAMGEKLDGRSDIFSLGVVAFEMLSGQQPFPGPNVTSILYKLVHTDPIEPPGLELLGLVPQKWREVFQKVLSKKPENRYQTASSFVQDLEYCLGSWFTGLGDEDTVAIAPIAEGRVDDTVTLLAIDDLKPGVAPDDIETVLIPRVPAPAAPLVAPPPMPVAAAASAAPVLAREAQEETIVLAPGGVDALASAANTTLAMERSAALAEPFQPATVITSTEDTAIIPPAAAQTQPDPFAAPRPPMSPSAATPARPRSARPGVPLPLALGAVAALLALVALGAWALRPRAADVGATTPATVPPVTEPAKPVVPSETAAAATGSLRVVSEPAGARVTINGEARGRTPLELGELAFGRYDVRVEQAGFGAEARKVELLAGSPAAELRVTLKPRAVPTTGSAEVVSTPSGAVVSVDGIAVGQTPIKELKLAAGKRRLEVALAGHESWTSLLDVVAGQSGRVDVKLKEKPAPPPTPEPVDVTRVYPNEAGQVDTPARKLSGASPSYPSSRAPRLKSGQRVSVLVRFVVTETGEVGDVTVVESVSKLVDDVVVAAVKGWKYEPATKGGVKVKVETNFRQTFMGG
jgi:serine/threonine-protein kinase